MASIKFIIILILFLLITPLAFAHCPLCTVVAGTGIGITRIYGVDDSITGLFLGALIASSALWFNKWIRKKKINIPFQEFLIIFSSFLLLVIPLYITGTITSFDIVKSSPNQYSLLGLGKYGIDKLFFGIIIGTLAVWFAFSLSNYLREKRKKVLWPYQGLSFMLTVLVILSLMFWILT